MRDWKQYVREHLPSLELTGAREQEIVDELAQQFEDAVFRSNFARNNARASRNARGRTDSQIGMRWPMKFAKPISPSRKL